MHFPDLNEASATRAKPGETKRKGQKKKQGKSKERKKGKRRKKREKRKRERNNLRAEKPAQRTTRRKSSPMLYLKVRTTGA
jgi:hypothetical protein